VNISLRPLAPLKSAFNIFAPVKLVRKKLTPVLLAINDEPKRLAPEKFASERLVSERLAPERLAPERLAPERLAPERLAPERLHSLRSTFSPRIVQSALTASAGD